MNIKLNNKIIATVTIENDSYIVDVKTFDNDRTYCEQKNVYTIDKKIDMFKGGVKSHVLSLLKRDFN